ncbi:MAG: hypothetical protein ACE5E7_08080 [Anaerolineae bacterium]
MKRPSLKQCALFLVIFLVACSSQPDPNMDNNGLGDDEVMPGVVLAVSALNETPEPGETVVLNINLAPHEEMQQAKLSLTLPPEVAFPDEQFAWEGDLRQGKIESIQVEVKILDWPLSEPIKITLTDNISTFWAYWPAEEEPELPERRRGTPEARLNDIPLDGLEPAPSVAVTLQVEPPDPGPGELTHFMARLTAESDFSGVSGRFELPRAFQLEAGSSLKWQGDLAQGVEQTIDIFATPSREPVGDARFVINLQQGETIRGIHTFGPIKAAVPRYRPEGTAVQSDVQPPIFVPDEDGNPEVAPAEPNSLPPIDVTVVERAHDADQVAFTLFLFANEDVTNASASFLLPPSYALLEGSLDWKGDLSANDLIPLELRLERLSNEPASLEVRFSSDQGSIAPFIHQLNLPPDTASGGGEPAAPTALNLSGRFMYDEDLSTARGIYYTRVEVYDADSGLEGGDDFVCYDTTDSNGYWSCSGSASDIFDNTVEIYALVRAYNSNNGVVTESDGTEYKFKTTNYDMPESGGTHDFGSWWPGTQGGNPQDGAFHIHKMGTYGNNTTQYLGGETPPIDGEAHFVTFVWPDTDADSTSEYSNWTVKLEGPGATDEDQWDESVILHEYGHYLMDHFAVLGTVDYCHPPTEATPCSHSFNSHEDSQTAYIEGYPNYYQSAVKRYYSMANEEMYIETTWSFDIEASWHSPTTTWDDAESTIAGILWDLNDSPNDDQDGDGVGDEINQNHQEIHDVFSNNPGGYGTPVDIHDFYTSYQSRYAYDDSLIRIYYEHGIDKDSTSPTGSVSVSSGATYATSTSVTLNLSGSDPYPGTGVTQMIVSNSSFFFFATWESYSATKSWTLSSSNGTRTVYVKYKDGSGNISTAYSDSIILDTVAPANPTSLTSSSHAPSVWSNDTTVDVSWSGASDSTSGVYGYGLYWNQSPSSSPSQIVDTTGTSDTSSLLSDGDNWYFHLITRDNAGNWSGDAVHLGPFYIDTTGPTGSLSVDGGATYATSTAVTLNLSASDASPGSGVAQMRVRNFGSSWSAWESYSATKSWTLPSSNGTKTVYVQYKDDAGNLSSTYSDTIVLDTAAPSNPSSLWSSSHTTAVWSNDPTVVVNWSGASDSTSGVNGYGLLWSETPTGVPSQSVDTTGTSNTSSSLSDGASWYFHLITGDNAGNWSSSALHLGPFYIDTIAPTSSVVAMSSLSPCYSFQVGWGGTDSTSGIASYDVQYRVGSGGTWTNWLTGTSATSATFGPTSPITATPGETIYFRSRATDQAGNVEGYPTGNGDAWTTISNCVYLPIISR